MSSPEIEVWVKVLKALADESRLRMLGLLAGPERSVEELAELLGLKGPTVSHHLARLKGVGLVAMRAEGNTHLYRLDADALRDLKRDWFTPEGLAAVTADVAGEAWEQKILRDFFVGKRLKEIPASRKKREVVLRYLAAQFAYDMRYPEREVNAIIDVHHPDFATLRRELIGAKLLARDAGVYWRL